MDTIKKIGFLVNPLAGIGGRVSLKGSDGADIVQKAMMLGAVPEAPARAVQALELLKEEKNKILFLTGEGELGADLLKEKGFDYRIVSMKASHHTTAKDTKKAVRKMMQEDMKLLLFAGGDGTARDIQCVIGDEIPVIGIPAGVKMHSAVYAINPRNAGLAAREYLQGSAVQLADAEVMDIDEDLFRKGIVDTKLCGYMKIPDLSARMQCKKAGSISTAEELDDMSDYVVRHMTGKMLYFVGPGSTTRSIMEKLGLPNTLLGVDVVQNKQLLASDVTEHQIWDLIQTHDAKIILTPIGGQGILLGRGNQQFSPRVLRHCARENLVVVATVSKLLSLQGRSLIVDTGDVVLDNEWSKYVEVITGYKRSTIYLICN